MNNLIGRKVLVTKLDRNKVINIAGGTLNYYGLDYWKRLICVIDRCPIHLDDKNHKIIEHPGYLMRDPENDKKLIYAK